MIRRSTGSMRLLTLFGLLYAVANAQYQLQSTFSGLSFFENFDFYTSWDPTFGYVHYVDQAVADQHNMINITESSVSWGVDTTQILNPDANLGRLSIRLTTIQSWTHGLFILDLAHMPGNTCGVWPAVWTLGSGIWPTNGEIDIIEFVKNVPNNLMALHTSPGCSVAGADETGTLISSDCGASGGLTGCTVSTTTADNSGFTFNANGGGVYAMEWTSTAIRVWFFPRNAIPVSITSGTPNVDAFGVPMANCEGSCDIDAHFYNHSLVFNIDFCGQYAGNVWESNGCPMLEAGNGWQSCNDFVALNPQAFTETYWEVNYLKIYQLASGSASTSSSSLSSVTPAISTSAVSMALSGAQGRSSTYTESLAGTVPSITTGSFTATSSVLSVLSSLSTKSAASASSVSASSSSATLVGRATSASSISTSSLSISTSSPVPSFTSALPSSVSSTSVSTATTGASGVPGLSTFTPTSVSSPAMSCSGNICTSYAYVTVVATVTVNAVSRRTPHAESARTDLHTGDLDHRQVPGMHHGEPTTYWPEPLPTSTPLVQRDPSVTFTLCDFTIRDATETKLRKTDFACALTREEIFNGTLYTETLIANTALLSGRPLDFGSLLYIEDISMRTISAAAQTSISENRYTGSFTPNGTFTTSTKLTAYPDISLTPTTASSTTTTNPRPIMSPPPHTDFAVADAGSGRKPRSAERLHSVYLDALESASDPTSRQIVDHDTSLGSMFTSTSLNYDPSSTAITIGEQIPRETVTESLNEETTVVELTKHTPTLVATGTDAAGAASQRQKDTTSAVTTSAYSTIVTPPATTTSRDKGQATESESNPGHSTMLSRLLSSVVPILAMLVVVL